MRITISESSHDCEIECDNAVIITDGNGRKTSTAVFDSVTTEELTEFILTMNITIADLIRERDEFSVRRTLHERSGA